MHQTCQELIKRQGNKPERTYIELVPGTPVWVQHRWNATWEPATVVKQCTPNSYWIMQENGTEQTRVYRCTRTMLKIRSTPTEGKQTAQMKEWTTESRSIESIWDQRLCDREFSKIHFIRHCEAATTQFRSSRF